jgi:DHA2 family methylenomycin A resistance protein-like MFS transporter
MDRHQSLAPHPGHQLRPHWLRPSRAPYPYGPFGTAQRTRTTNAPEVLGRLISAHAEPPETDNSSLRAERPILSHASLPTPASAAAASAPDAPHARIVLAIGSLGFFLITLDISIVNVALPNITRELGGGTTGQQWTIDGYTLLFAALLLFAGNLADRIGAKNALGLGIVTFTLASAACAAAPSIGVLIASRCLQGAGAAVLLPASMALIREAFPDARRRARALGVWAVGGAVAALVGQPLGGLLTTADWRLVFTINLPVGIGMVLFLLTVAASPTRPARFDWPGQILAIVALAGLVYGLIEGGHAGYTSPRVIVTLVAAAVAIVAFVIVQARADHPMMPLTLFRSNRFRIALSVGIAFMIGNYGNVFTTSTSSCPRCTRAWSTSPPRSSPSPATSPAARSPTGSARGCRSSPAKR